MSVDVESLPPGWAKTTLGEIVTPTRPRHSPADYDLPFIGMEHIEAHSMRLLGTVPCRMMSSSAVHFYPNDVLYGRLRPYLNKVYRPDFEGLCSAEFIVLTENAAISARFLQYFLNSTAFVAFASHLNEGDRPRVDYTQISAYPINLPPLSEQTRIVEEIETQFSRLDTGVAALKRIQVNLKRYRAAVLKTACEGKLVSTEAELARQEARDYEAADVLLQRILKERRERWEAEQLAKLEAQGKLPLSDTWKTKYAEPSAPDTSELPALPEGWCWATIETIGNVVTGFTPPTSQQEFFGGDIPFFKPTDLEQGYNVRLSRQTLTREGAKVGRLLKANAVLVTCIGATIGKTGFSRVLCTTNQQINAIEMAEFSVLPEWCYWYIISPESQKKIVADASATTLPIINKSKFEGLPFPIPPQAEQERIVAEVERRLSVVEETEKLVAANMKRAERLRQALLQRAFSGKLVPQDPNDEPASVLLERVRAERETAAPKRKPAKRTEPNPRQTHLELHAEDQQTE